MVSIRVSFKFILADMVTAGLTMEVPTNKHRASGTTKGKAASPRE